MYMGVMVLVAQEVAEVQGLSRDDIIVDNYRSIYGGDDVEWDKLVSGVTSSNITVHNSGGILGSNGVNSGDGINGSNLFITNDNMISGGYGIKQGEMLFLEIKSL